MVDSLLHEVVRHIHTPTLGRHHARGAGETVRGVVVQSVLALRDARTPGALVARLRRAADASAMACLAVLFIELVAVLRLGQACARRTDRSARLDLERRI